jgi:hypothetical protein
MNLSGANSAIALHTLQGSRLGTMVPLQPGYKYGEDYSRNGDRCSDNGTA